MDFRIKKLPKKSNEIQEFHDKFCAKIKYDVPVGYFDKGDCFGMYVNHNLVAGFCLVNAPPFHLRSIMQIPDILYEWYKYDEVVSDVCEFTGYFIDDKRFALLFTLYLVWVVFTYKASQFVYSYPSSQKGLEKYYSYGNPIRLFTGIPCHLDKDTPGLEEEHVEIISKWGIFKIFAFRTLRYFSWRRLWQKSMG